MRAFACDASACDANALASHANARICSHNGRGTRPNNVCECAHDAWEMRSHAMRCECAHALASHMLALYALASYANARKCSHNGRYALLTLQIKYTCMVCYRFSIWCVVIHVAFVLGRNNNRFVSSTVYQSIWPIGLSTHNFVATISQKLPGTFEIYSCARGGAICGQKGYITLTAWQFITMIWEAMTKHLPNKFDVLFRIRKDAIIQFPDNEHVEVWRLIPSPRPIYARQQCVALFNNFFNQV